MVTREQILGALSGAGLSPHPTMPPAPGAGDAWPRWRNTRWANNVPGGVRLGSWWVYVALPNASTDTTVAEADPIVESIGDALMALDLHIELVEPLQLPVEPGGAAIPVLRYSVND